VKSTFETSVSHRSVCITLAQDEYMLIARGLLNDEGPVNCTVHSMTTSSATSRTRRPRIHEISPRIFVASVQFERPFDYRSSLAFCLSFRSRSHRYFCAMYVINIFITFSLFFYFFIFLNVTCCIQCYSLFGATY